MVGECEVNKEERDALEEEMRKLDVCVAWKSLVDKKVARKRSLPYEIDGGRRRRNRTGIG